MKLFTNLRRFEAGQESSFEERKERNGGFL